MQIVIDIPEEDYNDIITCNPEVETEYVLDLLMKCVENGTVLPEHGRLIDAGELWDAYHYLDCDFYEALDRAQPILEATKGG